jgi:hypothetical protein
MVMIVNDLPIDQGYQSGASGFKLAPSVVQRQLRKSEFLDSGFAFYQGSGGVVATFSSRTTSGTNTEIYGGINEGLASIINEIRLAFDLTKEELAKVCKVKSRKTVYNWIDGTSRPRKEAMSRIFDLILIARAWSNSGFKVNAQTLHKLIIDQQSMFELLQKTNLDKELILFAGSRLAIEPPEKVSFSSPFA